MNPTSTIRHGLVCAFLGIAVFGCNGAPQGFPQVIPCKITILKENVPLPEVTVKFISDGNKEWLAAGTSDQSGVVEVHTLLGDYMRKGAPPGKHKIILSQVSQVKSPYTQQQLFDMSPAEKETEKLRREKEIEESRSFPVEFEKAATTPLFIDVVSPTTEIRLDVAEWIEKK